MFRLRPVGSLTLVCFSLGLLATTLVYLLLLRAGYQQIEEAFAQANVHCASLISDTESRVTCESSALDTAGLAHAWARQIGWNQDSEVRWLTSRLNEYALSDAAGEAATVSAASRPQDEAVTLISQAVAVPTIDLLLSLGGFGSEPRLYQSLAYSLPVALSNRPVPPMKVGPEESSDAISMIDARGRSIPVDTTYAADAFYIDAFTGVESEHRFPRFNSPTPTSPDASSQEAFRPEAMTPKDRPALYRYLRFSAPTPSFANLAAAIDIVRPEGSLNPSGGAGGQASEPDLYKEFAARTLSALDTDPAVRSARTFLLMFTGYEQFVILWLFFSAFFIVAARLSHISLVSSATNREKSRISAWIAKWVLPPAWLRQLSSTAENLSDKLTLARDELELDRLSIRVSMQLLPAVGFIGTVRGMMNALGDAGSIVSAVDQQAQQAAVTEVSGLLALAFATTFLALLANGVLTIANALDERAVLTILNRIEATSLGLPVRARPRLLSTPAVQRLGWLVLVLAAGIMLFTNGRASEVADAGFPYSIRVDFATVGSEEAPKNILNQLRRGPARRCTPVVDVVGPFHYVGDQNVLAEHFTAGTFNGRPAWHFTSIMTSTDFDGPPKLPMELQPGPMRASGSFTKWGSSIEAALRALDFDLWRQTEPSRGALRNVGLETKLAWEACWLVLRYAAENRAWEAAAWTAAYLISSGWDCDPSGNEVCDLSALARHFIGLMTTPLCSERGACNEQLVLPVNDALGSLGFLQGPNLSAPQISNFHLSLVRDLEIVRPKDAPELIALDGLEHAVNLRTLNATGVNADALNHVPGNEAASISLTGPEGFVIRDVDLDLVKGSLTLIGWIPTFTGSSAEQEVEAENSQRRSPPILSCASSGGLFDLAIEQLTIINLTLEARCVPTVGDQSSELAATITKLTLDGTLLPADTAEGTTLNLPALTALTIKRMIMPAGFLERIHAPELFQLEIDGTSGHSGPLDLTRILYSGNSRLQPRWPMLKALSLAESSVSPGDLQSAVLSMTKLERLNLYDTMPWCYWNGFVRMPSTLTVLDAAISIEAANSESKGESDAGEMCPGVGRQYLSSKTFDMTSLEAVLGHQTGGGVSIDLNLSNRIVVNLGQVPLQIGDLCLHGGDIQGAAPAVTTLSIKRLFIVDFQRSTEESWNGLFNRLIPRNNIIGGRCPVHA